MEPSLYLPPKKCADPRKESRYASEDEWVETIRVERNNETNRGRQKWVLLGIAVLVLLGGVVLVVVAIKGAGRMLETAATNVNNSVGEKGNAQGPPPTLSPSLRVSSSDVPSSSMPSSNMPTPNMIAVQKPDIFIPKPVRPTIPSNGGCEEGWAPFVLHMKDTSGDGGWGGATITIQSRNGNTPEIAYNGTCDGVMRKVNFCLRTFWCYSVTLKGGRQHYNGEISWSIRSLDGSRNSLSEESDIAYGSVTDTDCTFAVTNSHEMPDADCSWTCWVQEPTQIPTEAPTQIPSEAKTPLPSMQPSVQKTEQLIKEPAENGAAANVTRSADVDPATNMTEQHTADEVTYRPGELTVMKEGLVLSTGLDLKIIARSGERMETSMGLTDIPFHERPDFGGVFPVPENHYSNNTGGWVYVSNSELDDRNGGVGSITFDGNGTIIDYKMVLRRTTRNCGGGPTPWGTWISAEEILKTRKGHIYEVDPFGATKARKTVLGGKGGAFESFAYDVRNMVAPRFFVTEDDPKGALRRFTPKNFDWSKPTEILHNEGTMEYLLLSPLDRKVQNRGTYEWTTDMTLAEENAMMYYRNSEGLDVDANLLFFVSKKQKEMFTLDLDAGTWTKQSTQNGAFDGQPDALQRVLGDHDMLYFTEDGGDNAGVHGRDKTGRYFTILESRVYNDETTGLAFSPDAKHMYLAYQKNGLLFDVWRRDGFPFKYRTLNVKYHNTESTQIAR